MSRAGLSALSFVGLLCFAVPSCILVDEYPNCPTRFEGEEARARFESIRRSLQVYGISLFGEKVYVATSGGILEFTDDGLDRLYKCRPTDSDWYDVAGVDRTSGIHWFYNSRDFRLLQFDGDKWNSQEPPRLPEPEYYSREDVHVGFEGFNYDGKFVLLNKHRFTLTNVRRAWTYEGDNAWTAFQLPDMLCALENPERFVEKGCLREIGPVGNELCAVMYADSIGQAIAEGRTVHEDWSRQTDIVACTSRSSWRVLNPEGTPEFFIDKVVSKHNAMYATTKSGRIFRIAKSGPESVPTLGEVEALTVSSDGHLVVWFAGKGIYKLRGEWEKVYDVPFEPVSSLQGKLIEENQGTIVVTASQHVGIDRDSLPDLVWIMNEGKIRQIL